MLVVGSEAGRCIIALRTGRGDLGELKINFLQFALINPCASDHSTVGGPV